MKQYSKALCGRVCTGMYYHTYLVLLVGIMKKIKQLVLPPVGVTVDYKTSVIRSSGTPHNFTF